MGYTFLGGMAAGLVACCVRWPQITGGELLPGFHPMGVGLFLVVMGGAVGLGLAGTAAYPLYRTYGPGSSTARLLSFTLGMLAVPVLVLGVMLWTAATR